MRRNGLRYGGISKMRRNGLRCGVVTGMGGLGRYRAAGRAGGQPGMAVMGCRVGRSGGQPGTAVIGGRALGRSTGHGSDGLPHV